MTIPSLEAAQAISRLRGRAVVIATMSPLRLWSTVSDRPELDVPLVGCMGKASSMGLGLALARPERQVLVLDGDGSLIMNLGSLVTIANKAPRNLVHFVFDDGVYHSVGDIPIPGGGSADLALMARAAGYPAVYDFDNLEELVTSLEELLHTQGPVFVRLRVYHTGPLPPLPPLQALRDAVRDLPLVLERSRGVV